MKLSTLSNIATLTLLLAATPPRGLAQDEAVLDKQARAAATPRRSVVGPIHPLLARKLAEARGAPVTAGVWLRLDPKDVDFRELARHEIESGLAPELAQKRLIERVRAGVAKVLLPAREALSKLGVAVRETGDLAPLVYVDATASGIDAIADLPIVDTIYPAVVNAADGMGVRTHRWDRVRNFGITGKGVKVAVIEDDRVFQNPLLNLTGFYQPAAMNVAAHATAVAGVLGYAAGPWNDPDGHNPGIEIVSANTVTFNEPDVVGGTNWSIAQGCRVLNMSFGADTGSMMVAQDRFVDYLVRYLAVTIAKSAGNNGFPFGTGTGNISSPGLAWNVITVGNVDDAGDDNWANDTMNPSSSFVNPISVHGDREKPELCAVGTNIVSTDLAGGASMIGSGTSFSTPAIASMAAGLMQAEPALSVQPEAVKAIMMAAATHNIEGASRLSDKDGAGCINGLQAYRIVEKRQFIMGNYVPASFPGGMPSMTNVWLQGGDRARVCLSWTSNANAAYTTDLLQADLDLSIVAGQNQAVGNPIAFSSSFDNSFEIVDFVPPATGWYTIRVTAFSFLGANEPFGLAWTQDADGRHARLRDWTTVPGDAGGPIIGEPYFGLELVARNHSWAQYVVALSLSANAGLDLPGGRHIYADYDFLTNLSLQANNGVIFNNIGQLDGWGEASPQTSYTPCTMAIPDLAALAGTHVHATFVTLDPNGPLGIGEIAEDKDLVVQGHPTVLNLPDGGYAANVPIGFSFPFYGQNWNQCEINASGNVTFGGQAGQGSLASQNLQAFITDLPRIAPLWHHFDPPAGGTISYSHAGDRFMVVWNGVAASGTTNSNTATLTLFANGTIEFRYHEVAIQDAICGITPGALALPVTNWPAIDITKGLHRTTTGQPLYEEFTTPAHPFDMNLHVLWNIANVVRFTRTNANTYQMTVDMEDWLY